MKRRTSIVRSVGSFEAKAHLPRLFDEVAAGGEIVITKRGIPGAKLVAVKTEETAPDDFIADWFAYRRRRGITTGGHSVRSMIDDR